MGFATLEVNNVNSQFSGATLLPFSKLDFDGLSAPLTLSSHFQ